MNPQQYAIHNRQFEICRFLISAGADADALEPDIWDRGRDAGGRFKYVIEVFRSGLLEYSE